MNANNVVNIVAKNESLVHDANLGVGQGGELAVEITARAGLCVHPQIIGELADSLTGRMTGLIGHVARNLTYLDMSL